VHSTDQAKNNDHKLREKFIICQRNCDEEVNICTHNSKSSFLTSEGMCIKLTDEYGSLDQIQYDLSFQRILFS
jgi:hypothetical protein